MKALKSRAAVIAGALLATSAMLMPLAAPAGATTPADTCTMNSNPSSLGSQSALRVSCTFNTSATTPAQNVISDFSNAQWHNGAASAVNGVAIDMGADFGHLVGIVSPNTHPDGTYVSAYGVYVGNTNVVNHNIAGTIDGKAFGAYVNVKLVSSAFGTPILVLNQPASTLVKGLDLTGASALSGKVVDAKLENSTIRAGIGAYVSAGQNIAAVTAITAVSAIPSQTVSVTYKVGAAGTGYISSTANWNTDWVGATINGGTKITNGPATITQISGKKAYINKAIPANVTTASNATVSRAAVEGRAAVAGVSGTAGIVVSPTIGFSASDVGRSISGTTISAGSTISAVRTCTASPANCLNPAFAGYTAAVVNGITEASQADLTGAVAKPNQISVGAEETVTTARIINDQTYTGQGGQTITSATAGFSASDIGLPISGCGVQTYADSGTNNSATPSDHPTGQNYITAVGTDGANTWATTAGPLYGNSFGVIPNGDYDANDPTSGPQKFSCTQAFGSYGINLTIGQPSSSAPATGDAMSMITSTLNESPTLVPGADACTANTYEGTTIMGQWYNPGTIGASAAFSGYTGATTQSVSVSFSPSLSLTPIKAVSGSIGAIKYPTSVVSFWAFVSQRTASETVGGKSFPAGSAKITLPWVPTLLALCDTGSEGISSEYLFGGTSIGTQSVASGTARPSVALRGLKTGVTTGNVAYQPTTALSVASTWSGAGTFTNANALGQGVTVTLTKQ
jgi:hypothetical protein